MKKWPKLVLMLVPMTEAWALCLPPPPPAENIKGSAAVFTCEVLRTEKLGHRVAARVRVLESWKGVNPDVTLVLWGGASDDGYWEDTILFEPKERWLVFADTLAGGLLVTGGCSGSAQIKGSFLNDAIHSLGPSFRRKPYFPWRKPPVWRTEP